MRNIPIHPDFFHGHVSLEPKPGGLKRWRIPYRDAPLYPPSDSIPDKAAKSAGVRLRFEANSPSIAATLVLEEGPEASNRIDLVRGGHVLLTHNLRSGENRIAFHHLGSDNRIDEIWLPVFGAVAVGSLNVEDGTRLAPAADSRVRWLTYGSSITHCRTAASPARTWPATAARALDLSLTCLGFGGSCQLDPMVGRLMRDLPCDLVTMKLGINVYGSASHNRRSFQPAVIGLVKLLRERHPDIPVGLITPIFGVDRETKPNGAGMTLENYREELRAAHAALRDHGDDGLFLFEGFDLLGPGDAHLLPDQLHPNAEGYELMGERAVDNILRPLLASRAGGRG